MTLNDRRSFLQASASGLLLLKPSTVFGTQANSALELGVIGCGGRGNYIGGFFVLTCSLPRCIKSMSVHRRREFATLGW